MADLSAVDQENLERKSREKFSAKWCAGGEQLRWLLLPEHGYLASTVAGRTAVPHAPLNEIRPSAVDDPEWPLPSEVVTSGRFLDDEWADDPSILWWAFADRPDRDAVRFADHGSAVPGAGFLVLSSQRLAVVVEQGKLAAERPAEDAGGKGLFGRVRSAAAQVQQAAEGIAAFKDAKDPVSYVEVPVSRIAAINPVPLGRDVPRKLFLRIGFADGSVLFARDREAEVHAAKSR